MGYGTSQKGYRLYDVECMKIVHSRDVVFDETSIPGIQKETTVPTGCSRLFGLDYEETFSPVVRFESIRFSLAMGAQQ